MLMGHNNWRLASDKQELRLRKINETSDEH